MSHNSTIKTKNKNKPELIEALEQLQKDVIQDSKLENLTTPVRRGGE